MAELEKSDVSLDVTVHPSSAVHHANLDVVRWREIMTHRMVLMQGTLPYQSQRDALLFSQLVSPSALKSQTHKSAVAHLAELFTQWNGTIVFELVTTLPAFVATKIVMAFLPSPLDHEQLSAGSLVGLQNSVILNPSNQYSAHLRVPFVAAANWLGIGQNTGHLVARLLEPMVSTLEMHTGLPWTLSVCVDPDDFNFRYLVPPLLPTQGSSVAAGGPTLADNITAVSMSTTKRRGNQRTTTESALVVQGQPAPGRIYESMMLIPRSRVEYVMQKVRGQFPHGTAPADVVRRMFQVPGYSLKDYAPVSLPPLDNLYPILKTSFYKPHLNQYPDDANVPVDAQVFTAYANNTRYLYIEATPEQDSLADLRPSFHICMLPPDYDLGTTYQAVAMFYLTFNSIKKPGGRIYHRYLFGATGEITDWVWPSRTLWVNRVIWCYQTGPDNTEFLVNALRQIDDCPSEVTHLALYTTMEPSLARTFTEWLTTSDNSSPPAAALSHLISFSPNQASLAYNDGRLVDDELAARGIVWRLFKLFKGDETKWWAWLVRGLDVIVDALIGAFLGRASTVQVVPIGLTSGFRVEAVGDYDPSLIASSSPSAYLEYVPPLVTPSLITVLAQVSEVNVQEIVQPSVASRPLSRFRRHSVITQQGDKSEPEQSITPLAVTPTGSGPSSPSRRHSPRWRARHPSSKKRFF